MKFLKDTDKENISKPQLKILFSNVEKNYKSLSESSNLIKSFTKTELFKDLKFKLNLNKKKNY